MDETYFPQKTRMDKNITKNYLYNLGYQVLLLIVPFIATPYIARVLGPELIGVYSFTKSISSYFILLGCLGINMYAQREIAYVKDDQDKRSQIFWTIQIVRGITVGCSLFLYLLLIKVYDRYSWLLLIQVIDILAVAIDITWYFQGMEQFKTVVARNAVVKILSVLSIFVLVKTKEDLLIYVAILSISMFVGNISLWWYVPKRINIVGIKKLYIMKHFKGSIQLFLPQIAMQVYLVLDKTMLGIMSATTAENGYYEQSQKLIKVLLAVVTSMGTVMTSRIAFLYAQKELKIIQKYIMKSLELVFFLGIPMFFGLLVIADEFVLLFFGLGYEKVIVLIKIFGLMVLLAGINNVTANQLLFPIGDQKKVTYAVLIGAIVNVILNLILIPKYLSIGVTIASVITEGIIVVLQLYSARNIIHLRKVLCMSRKYILSGFCMFLIIKFVPYTCEGVMRLSMQVLTGGIVYTVILLILNMGKVRLQKSGEKNG